MKACVVQTKALVARIKDRSIEIFLRKKKRCKVCGRRLLLWERRGLCRNERRPTVMDIAKAVVK